MNRLGLTALMVVSCLAGTALADQPKPQASGRPNTSIRIDVPADLPATKVAEPAKAPAIDPLAPSTDDFKGLRSVFLVGLVSLAPAALLMFTSFVRINIVLILLRQALGSPQVPGNQVLFALSLLLSSLVMWPVGNSVYTRAIQPYAASERTSADAWKAWEEGSKPIKTFMIDQLERTHHTHYLNTLYDIAEPWKPSRFEPTHCDEFPLRVIAPAFLLSELTTALMIGFLIYLPFLVIDLVVSAVLSAMGLFMLPPSLVSMPLKLILFVLADGWLLVATALLKTFAV
jgi:flagellar biosynthetic protein FliP